MVVFSPASAAVFRTALRSWPSIFGASLPMPLASTRIGTTSATTTSTSTPPIVNPRIQPNVLTLPPPAASTPVPMCVSSDRLAEVPHGLQARVDRGQSVGHGGRQVGHRGHAPGDLTERGLDRPQVEDDPQQANGGDADDQRGDDQGAPSGSWHGWHSFLGFG